MTFAEQVPGLTVRYQRRTPRLQGLVEDVLTAIAGDVESSVDLTDYQRRREALRGWSLAPDTWNDIVAELPPVPGPVRPNLDDRKRQEASAFVWAPVTRGEPRFAPRPIEADQPDRVRRDWRLRRSSTWFQLSRPDPLNHYAALRQLLVRHAEDLTSKIDASPLGYRSTST